MTDVLKAFYNAFYIPPNFPALTEEVEKCHDILKEKLEKPERKLVLRIIDAQSELSEYLSQDSFNAGFHLALQLCVQLQGMPMVDAECYYRGNLARGDGGAA